MTDNMDFTLSEALRKSEAERERLERSPFEPSWERARILEIEAKLDAILSRVGRMEARMGEIAIAQEIGMVAVRKVEALENRLADDGR